MDDKRSPELLRSAQGPFGPSGPPVGCVGVQGTYAKAVSVSKADSPEVLSHFRQEPPSIASRQFLS